MLYAVERCTVTKFRLLCLPMHALRRIVRIGCTVTKMRADRLYLAEKGVYRDRLSPLLSVERNRSYPFPGLIWPRRIGGINEELSAVAAAPCSQCVPASQSDHLPST